MPIFQVCCSTATTQVEYNLYGMGFIRLRKARFRGQLPARGRAQRAGWSAVAEVLTYEEASTGEVPDDSPFWADPCAHCFISASVISATPMQHALCVQAETDLATTWDIAPAASPLNQGIRLIKQLRAGTQEAPPPVGTPISLSAAQYTRLWTASTTPADWVWGPLPYGGRCAVPEGSTSREEQQFLAGVTHLAWAATAQGVRQLAAHAVVSARRIAARPRIV